MAQQPGSHPLARVSSSAVPQTDELWHQRLNAPTASTTSRRHDDTTARRGHTSEGTAGCDQGPTTPTERLSITAGEARSESKAGARQGTAVDSLVPPAFFVAVVPSCRRACRRHTRLMWDAPALPDHCERRGPLSSRVSTESFRLDPADDPHEAEPEKTLAPERLEPRRLEPEKVTPIESRDAAFFRLHAPDTGCGVCDEPVGGHGRRAGTVAGARPDPASPNG